MGISDTLIDGFWLTIFTGFQPPFNRRLHMKFEENWPKGYRGEVVQMCGRKPGDGRTATDDGRRDHNNSSWALLRWAKTR